MWRARLRQAETVIRHQNEAINTKEETIKNNEVEIKGQKETIVSQHEEISHKSRIIHYQNLTLIISILSLLIITTLLIFLLKINKKKKLANQEVKEKNKHILFSLDYAKKLQDALLPKASTIYKTFNKFTILYRPKDIVSGDFYWMEIIDGKVFFAVADCTGHGVPGAMMSVICSKALTKAVKEKELSEPARILDFAVDEISSYFSKSDVTINDGMDISLICIESKLNKLTYAGANNPLYYFEKDQLLVLKPDKQPVGAYDYRHPFKQQVLTLNTIKSMYLFSDGYTDQFGGDNNKKISKKRFRSLLTSIQQKTMQEQNDILTLALDDWQNSREQIDDICVVGIDLSSFTD